MERVGYAIFGGNLAPIGAYSSSRQFFKVDWGKITNTASKGGKNGLTLLKRGLQQKGKRRGGSCSADPRYTYRLGPKGVYLSAWPILWPYGILAVCRHNLWPAVRMELGQEGWRKQLVAKLIAKTTSKEDLSWPVIRDHIRVTNVARHC